MPVINVAVGKSRYKIDCPAEEEEKIQNLSTKVNERVNKLSLAVRGADERTILMLCAVMIEEELEGLKSKTNDVSDADNKNSNIDDANNDKNAIINNIEEITNYIEKLVNKIQSF